MANGVNIAARVEALTEPGGIFITGAAYDLTKNKVKARLEDLGSRTVKNLRDPVRVYRVAIHEVTAGGRTVTRQQSHIYQSVNRRAAAQYARGAATADSPTA
jgi:class 3 adenylate cyclase